MNAIIKLEGGYIMNRNEKEMDENFRISEILDERISTLFREQATLAKF